MNSVNRQLEEGADINMIDYFGYPLLHTALIGGACKLEDIRRLLDLGADIHSRNRLGETPLHHAAFSCSFDIIKLLLDCGARTDVLDNEGLPSLLHYALSNPKCELDFVKLLLDQGFDISSVDGSGQTPLHLAAKFCSFDVIRHLIDQGAEMDVMNNLQQSPFHCALMNSMCTVDIIKQFLDKGIDISLADGSGRTPLYHAALNCSFDVIKLLFEHGAQTNGVDSRFRMSPFHCAIKNPNCNLNFIRLFLDRGASLSSVCSRGRTPFHYALCYALEDDAIKLFLDRGVEIYLADTSGVTPLHLAVCGYSSDIITILLDAGAQLDAVDKDRQTPLHYALKRRNFKLPLKHRDVIELLLDRGADVNSRCALGFSPLHNAILKSVTLRDVLQLLLDRKADVNAVDEHFKSPLYHAAVLCFPDKMKVLLDYGALVYTNFDSTFRNIVVNNSHLDNIESFFECLKLLTKYAFLENPSLEIDAFITMKEHNPHRLGVTNFAHECVRELHKMNSVNVSDDCTLYEFLSRRLQMKPDVERILSNILNALICDNYPIYREVISAELKRPVMMNKLYRQPMYTVSRNSNNKTVVLDYDSACYVVKYLCHDDLLNLILSFHTNDDCA